MANYELHIVELEAEEEPLTMNDLANAYDKCHSGRPARTLPMDKVIEWAEGRTDLFRVGEDDCFYQPPAPLEKS